MNRLFGYHSPFGETCSEDVVFEGTQPVTIRDRLSQAKAQFRVFASPGTPLLSGYSREHNAFCYVLGNPAHEMVAASGIATWCIDAITSKQYRRFRELLGIFVAIVEEPEENRITFVTDLLGICPMFTSVRDGRLVFGSDVWALYEAGMSDGLIDYDALSAWLAYGYNCTDGSLFSDLRRLPPGAVTTHENGQYNKVPYAEFEGGSQTKSVDQASEELHHIVSSTSKTLLADHSRVSIAVSGGYDSRYLLAMALSTKKKASLGCMNVAFTKAEGDVAHEVAERLGITLENVPVNASIWDLYDQVYHDTPDGFPISKFVTYSVAQRYTGIPMVNGFIGGSLMRGEADTIRDKYESECTGDLADILQEHHLFTCFRAFHKNIAEHIRLRSRVPIEEAVRKGSQVGHVFIWVHFYCRQRFYISNNFLQHRDLADVLLPFYSWSLLSYKFNHDSRVFSKDVYHKIFQSHFPQLAAIPHASDLPTNRRKRVVSRHTQRWARQLFPIMCGRERLALASRTWGIPMDLAGIMGLYRAEDAVFLLERLYLLEKKVRNAGLCIDWEAI
jgi:hypothetical protein